MFTNKWGHTIEHAQAVFPLISFDKKHTKYKCVGTGFFINPTGWFVTAKHVLLNNNDDVYEMIMGLQTLSTNTSVLRIVTHLSIHPTADIAIGKLGIARDGNAQEVEYELTPIFNLSFKKLETNDEIIAFGYPRTTKEVDGRLVTFNFVGKWTKGFVQSFYPEGSPLVRNKCYQTSMFLDTGTSGGPVFKNDLVVGINSSGWDIEGDEPLSFITPIDLLLDLQVAIDDTTILSVEDLIKLRYINVEQ
jgi:S1-C subfamily serine protease